MVATQLSATIRLQTISASIPLDTHCNALAQHRLNPADRSGDDWAVDVDGEAGIGDQQPLWGAGTPPWHAEE